MQRNSVDQKASKFLEQGLTSLKGKTNCSEQLPLTKIQAESIRSCRSSSGLLPDCLSANQWRGQILCYYYSYMAFLAASVADWAGMKAHLDKLQAASKDHGVSLTDPLKLIAFYVGGVYRQGVGDLDGALEIFKDSKFDLAHFQSSNLSSTSQILRDLSIMAALNTLLILQQPARRDHDVNAELVAKIEGICEHHPNKDVQTAFNLVLATINVNQPLSMIKIKQHLGNALSGAQATMNIQLLCITLNVMCNKFFANVAGEQAEKSAMAASYQAKKSGNTLWKSVAEGMLAKAYDMNGKKEEAAKTFEQARRMAQLAMPES